MQTSPVMSCFIAYIQTFRKRKFKNDFGLPINMWVKYTLNKMWTLFRFTGYLLLGFVHASQFWQFCLVKVNSMYKDNIIDQLPGSVSYKKSTDKIGGIMKHMFSWHFLTPTRSECRQLSLLKCKMHHQKMCFSFLFFSFLLIFPFWAVVTFYGFHVFLYWVCILWSY